MHVQYYCAESAEEVCTHPKVSKNGLYMSHLDPAPNKFRERKIHREEVSKSENLMNIIFPRQKSRKNHMRRLCKKDAPTEHRGIGQHTHELENANKPTIFSPREAKVMRAHTSKKPDE